MFTCTEILFVGVAFAVVILIYICVIRKKNVKKATASIMIVVGSGGHTKEILTLVQSIGQQYQPRHYIIANTDQMSEEKVHLLEKSKPSKKNQAKQYEIHLIPRSREVLQSWLSTIVSTVYAILYSIPLVYKIKPDIVLCNGPGTCIPVCLIAFLFKILKISHTRIIYVESICRVETLSLSGKILYHIADNMLVQWPELQEKYPKTQYIGRLV